MKQVDHILTVLYWCYILVVSSDVHVEPPFPLGLCSNITPSKRSPSDCLETLTHTPSNSDLFLLCIFLEICHSLELYFIFLFRGCLFHCLFPPSWGRELWLICSALKWLWQHSIQWVVTDWLLCWTSLHIDISELCKVPAEVGWTERNVPFELYGERQLPLSLCTLLGGEL